jgi:hypothetical protein
MWVRHGDVVSNLDNGAEFSLRKETDERGQDTWRVVHNRQGARYPSVLAEGYKSEDDGRKGLEGILSGLDVKPHVIESPADEEKTEAVDRGENVKKVPEA